MFIAMSNYKVEELVSEEIFLKQSSFSVVFNKA